ncbi:Methyltransferase type 12 [Minicystis rosea]|nr:Methyltransferase type 12 [Minicystis rosea]
MSAKRPSIPRDPVGITSAPKPRARRAKPDRELEAGTSAHYDDPAYYTKTYKGRVEDVRYYVDLAETVGGPVLEYGCGNGRITLPVARAGVSIVGVDLSAPMLADLRARLRDEPEEVRERVTVHRGDMRSFDAKRRFPLVICPFNAFLHLYERRDVERFLARVHAHLAPRGELVFDISIPEPAELARDPARAFSAPRFRYPDRDGRPGPMIRYTERFDYDRLRQVLFVAMEFTPTDGSEPWMTPLAHRQFHPQELEALLHYNGFSIAERYGDFFRSPLAADSHHMIVHCRPHRRGRR